ncbi:ferritin-like protein [Kordiimonas marina]|uniref:ferritin-like protein n=1 Tax=Kordiimonas marina TaxID=2872312 RepID=UPI001FF6EEAE|nr:ferritin-like protein [Kordiimonas marina]MCJ9429094.1 ferritin-like protein [Kordiimonas marina]
MSGIPVSPRRLGSSKRDISFRDTDAAAARAIAQAAVSVELFTIPLYMTTLYSLEGSHEAQGKSVPGMVPSAKPASANEKAFNTLFSVLIQEMLHLQLAANMASAIGCTPSFSDPALQSAGHGWRCYGPDQTVIPHIIDLAHTSTYADTRVQLGALTAEQIGLFIAIEEPEQAARDRVKPSAHDRYFPCVPFDGWTAGDALPLFGTIGWMYECYAEYLALQYTDGKSLWAHLYDPQSIQQDLFNPVIPGIHPMPEYPDMALTFTKDEAVGPAHERFKAMINAITDQGEGSTLNARPREGEDPDVVKRRYRPCLKALEADYPDGHAGAAHARFEGAKTDHYERFVDVRDSLVANVSLWPAGGSGGDYAAASKAAIDAIAVVTDALDAYWSGKADSFPFSAMTGLGARMTAVWADCGKAPDLTGA